MLLKYFQISTILDNLTLGQLNMQALTLLVKVLD